MGEICPHATLWCPDFEDDCRKEIAKECRHIKEATMSVMAAIATLEQIGFENLSEFVKVQLVSNMPLIESLGIKIDNHEELVQIRETYIDLNKLY